MRKVILLYLLFFSVGVIYADNDYVTVFKVAGNICTPVTLKTPYGTYEVTKEISIPKSMSWWEAFDCNGNKIMDTGGSVSMGTGKTTVRTYILKTLFPTTQKQEELENSNSVTESYSDSQYSGGGIVQELWSLL